MYFSVTREDVVLEDIVHLSTTFSEFYPHPVHYFFYEYIHYIRLQIEYNVFNLSLFNVFRFVDRHFRYDCYSFYIYSGGFSCERDPMRISSKHLLFTRSDTKNQNAHN